VNCYSTAQVARRLKIGRQTLHRWIAGGQVPAPRRQKVAGVTVRIWSAKDVELVRKYKAAHYRKGRGRKKGSKSRP
jgi:excisionase family DNA binding protein